MDLILKSIILFFGVLSILEQRASASRRHQDSILSLINVKEVQRILDNNANQPPKQKHFIIQNQLRDYSYQNEDATSEKPRVEVSLFLRRNNISAEELGPYNGLDLLKSSKNALHITQKEYLKRDWCKTEPLIQKIKEKGCLRQKVINRFCYGQCNSFYIPTTPKYNRNNKKRNKASEGVAFKSCSFCKPKSYTWTTVTLHCPNSTQKFRKKRIQTIKECKCMATDLG